MKLTTLFCIGLFSATFISCIDLNPENNDVMENETNYTEETSNLQKSNDALAFKTIMDKKTNLPLMRMPLPQSWNIVSDHPSTFIKGPDGIQVDNLRNQSFMATNDPYMQQVYAQSGAQLRAKINLAKVFAQDFTPQLKQSGFNITKQYPLPELTKKDRDYMSKLYETGPSQKEFEVLAVELSGPDNMSILFVVHGFSSFSQGLMVWGYYGEVLTAPTKKFENSKQVFLNALHNKEYNPVQIAAYNNNEKQKANESWGQHNQKMAQNQRNFEAQQNAFRNSSNAVNNSIMENWKNKNEASDRGHNKYINEGIWDQTTMTDPNSGQQYYVDNDAKNYWINSNGQYIKSDDANYNPNTDPDYNDDSWSQMDPTDDGGS